MQHYWQMSDRPEILYFSTCHFSFPGPHLVTQSGGVVLGGDVVVRDVNAAGLIHLDHVVTEPIMLLIIAEMTLLGSTEETN